MARCTNPLRSLSTRRSNTGASRSRGIACTLGDLLRVVPVLFMRDSSILFRRSLFACVLFRDDIEFSFFDSDALLLLEHKTFGHLLARPDAYDLNVLLRILARLHKYFLRKL